MKKVFLLHCVLFLLFITSLWNIYSQNSNTTYNKLDSSESFFDFQETNKDSLVLWQERVVLHIANEQVSNDDLLFFKGYLLTGVQQNRYSFSGVLNVELLDEHGTVLKKQFHKVVDGMVEGHMELPKNIAPGKYFLNAYTRWMRNYGEDFFALEDFWVGSPFSNEKETRKMSDIVIAPEGGTLLSDHENRLVIKTTHSRSTKSGQVGRIVDDKMQQVATVNYYSTGIGTTLFKPKKNKVYQLELGNGAIYPVPKAEVQGYLLYVNNLDENNAKIQVTASSDVSRVGVTLVGTSGGIRYFEKQLDFKAGNILNIDLAKKDIPYGVFSLKLVDDIGTVLARRPFWIDGERLYIDISPISSRAHEKAFKIKVTDKTNTPIKTQLALSANRYEVDNVRVKKEITAVRPNLFAHQEIVARGENATDRKKRFLKDLSILVSDAEFDDYSADDNSFESGITFPIQKGLELIGYAYDLDNKLLANTKIQIMANLEEEIWIRETETDVDGLLRLKEIQLNGNPVLIFRTKGKDTKSRLVKIIPLKESEQEKNSSFPVIPKKQEQARINENTSTGTADTRPLVLEDSTRLIELEEVEVSENRIENRKTTPSVYGVEAHKNRTKYQDPKRPKSIVQMLSEMPGVVASGIGHIYPAVSINRASGPILWIVDGFPLPQGDHGPSLGGPVRNSLKEVMKVVSEFNVERIELLMGADAAMYGSRGAGGVINIYTRSGKEQEFISRKQGQLVFEGFELIVDFERYREVLSKRTKEMANLIYWNPKLETDENGEVIIRIPVLPQDSKIMIEASTITVDGKIGSLSFNF